MVVVVVVPVVVVVVGSSSGGSSSGGCGSSSSSGGGSSISTKVATGRLYSFQRYVAPSKTIARHRVTQLLGYCYYALFIFLPWIKLVAHLY